MKPAFPIAGLAGLAGMLAALLPGRVLVRGDDFGYLETVVETVRRGAWTPSDWLEPFNLPLPILSLGLHAVTGNLWLATFGLNAAIFLSVYLLLRRWLRPATAGGELGLLALAVFPVWLNKGVEYTGVPLGVALTLAALLAWRRGRHRWFFAVVLLAVANRQSAVCLLALPVVELIRCWRTGRGLSRELAAGIALTAGATLALAGWWPVNFARVVAAARWREEFSATRLAGNLVLGVVILAGLLACWRGWHGHSWRAAVRANLARPALPLLLTLAGAWLVLGEPVVLACETPGWERAGSLLLVAATFLGAWAISWRFPLEPGFVACAGAYVALVAFRGQWWDYYFLEPAVVLLGAGDAGTASPSPLTHWIRGAGMVALAVAAVFLGRFLQRTEQQIVAYESALRAGTVAITEASDAPFGYLAWKLFPTARAHPEPQPRLTDFLRYVEGGRGRVVGDSIVVDREGGRRSLHPSREKRPLPPAWRGREFPLSAAEWRQYLERVSAR
ncbi:MAG: hypothetical protein HZC55_11340 [Verrucomicrobia bacterium]|nr:hypothetical protein [Verrucomicrobiota bacterium]